MLKTKHFLYAVLCLSALLLVPACGGDEDDDGDDDGDDDKGLVIQALDQVAPESKGNVASVKMTPDAAYAWTIEGGFFESIPVGPAVVFTAGKSGQVILRCTVTDLSGTWTYAPKIIEILIEPILAIPNQEVQQLSVEENHSCAIANGKAYCWGKNGYGQLGDGSTIDRTKPEEISGLVGNVSAISVGENHSCAVANGKAYCWGNNVNGRLGDGTTTNSTTPVAVKGLTGTVTAISAGGSHSCAIANGKAYCWGNNAEDQLGYDGYNSINNSAIPVAVGRLTGATAISAGKEHSCAISNGSVYCWGNNSNYQLGLGYGGSSRLPTIISDLTGTIIAISAGEKHSCAISNGSVYCWGNNANGQLGDGSTTTQPSPAVVSSGLSSPTNISTGTSHSCAISNEKAYCWGNNVDGQLGDGTTSLNRTIPVAVSILSGDKFTAISVNGTRSCAILDGAVYCWGTN